MILCHFSVLKIKAFYPSLCHLFAFLVFKIIIIPCPYPTKTSAQMSARPKTHFSGCPNLPCTLKTGYVPNQIYFFGVLGDLVPKLSSIKLHFLFPELGKFWSTSFLTRKESIDL